MKISSRILGSLREYRVAVDTNSAYVLVRHKQEDLVPSIDHDLELLSTLAHRLLSHHAQLRRQRNRVASATRDLPVEVFQKIIRQSLMRWPEQSDPARLEKLRTVCTSWSENILADRAAWAVIHFTYSAMPRQANKLLERSGDAALKIVLISGQYVLDAVIPHAARVQHVAISHPQRDVQKFLGQPMPQLRTIILGNEWGEPDEAPQIINLFSGVASNLHSIETTSTFLPLIAELGPGILQGVKNLCLIESRCVSGVRVPFSLGLLARLIATCSTMTSLELRIKSQPIPTEAAHESLLLPPLDSLKLATYSDFLGGLINHIHGHPARRYVIHDLDHFVLKIQPIMHVVLSFLNGAAAIALRVSEKYVLLQAYDETGPGVLIKSHALGYGCRWFKAAVSDGRLPPIGRLEFHLADTNALNDAVNSGKIEGLQEMGLKIEYRTCIEELGVAFGRRYKGLPTSLRLLEVWEVDRWVDRRADVAAQLLATHSESG